MGGGVVTHPETSCCCGHPPEYHLGGPDLDAEGLAAYRLTHLGGDGGMCREHGNGGPFDEVGGRCDCFNFCDCHVIVKCIRAEIAEDEAANA